MECFGAGIFLRDTWADCSFDALPIQDASNLVTTAQTTHLLGQKETHHLIQVTRHESNTMRMLLGDVFHVKIIGPD